jgi:hypothetical protein
MAEPRTEVLWFGEGPDDPTEHELRNRGLVRRTQTPGATLPPLRDVRAAVFFADPAGVQDVAGALRRVGATLLDHGVARHLVASDDRTLGLAQQVLDGWPLLGRLTPRTAPPPHEVPEQIARKAVGAGPRLDLHIEVAHDGRPLDECDVPLFQRAFHNCSRIDLVELTGGRSEARVFPVHLTVAGSRAGLWPQPFFAKVDAHAKVRKEFANYREFADRYIPFGLRPNVQEIVEGAERSLLAGDFVDRSESLWDLARRNVAASAISALVEETLVGWRNQAYGADPETGPLASVMQEAGLCDPERIKPSYGEQARRRGCGASAADIWASLMELQHQRYRLAPIHGDLHGENVRVRNGQAILIDLASVAARGPLTADLAALETWLAFELPPDEANLPYANPAWEAEIDRLNAPASFLHPPAPCEPTARYGWMSAVVRQIRHMGLAVQSCPDEYQTAVAIQLLRRCQWDDVPTPDHFRRAHGYVVAARLVEDLKLRSAM